MPTDIPPRPGTPRAAAPVHDPSTDGARISRGGKRNGQPQLSCSNCRARKVKCDRHQPSCFRCTKLNITCAYLRDSQIRRDSQVSHPETLTQAGLERRRIRNACQACRTYKAKCSGTAPCTRCEAHQLKCVYFGGVQTYQPAKQSAIPGETQLEATGSDIIETAIPHTPDEPALPESHILSGSNTHVFEMGSSRGGPESLPGDMTDESFEPNDSSLIFSEVALHNKSLIRKCIDAYFDCSDPTYCITIHKALFLARLNNGNIDRNVLQIVCASGLRLMTQNFDSGSTSFLWAKAVHANLLAPRALEKSTPSAVQALVLLIRFYFASEAAQDAWVLLSVASRLAFVMRLNYEQPTPSSTLSPFDKIGRECLRRIMWAIYVLDKLFSGGIEDLTLCPSYRMHILLPCNTSGFQQGHISKSQILRGSAEQSSDSEYHFDMDAVAYRIRLFELRERIFRYTRGVISDGSSPIESDSQLRALDEELQRFRDTLPPGLRMNSERLVIMAHSQECAPYIALHCMWYLCRCDLHRFLIPGIREAVSREVFARTPQTYVDHCQQICFEAAASIIDLISDVFDLGTSANMRSPSFAVTLFQSGQVLHHLAFRAPATGPHALHELQYKLSKACNLISHIGKIYQWLAPCIGDIKDMVSSLGLRGRDSETPDQRNNFANAPHARSKHVFVPSASSISTLSPDETGIEQPTDGSLRTSPEQIIAGGHIESSNRPEAPSGPLRIPSGTNTPLFRLPLESEASRYLPFTGYGITDTMFPLDPMQVELEYYADAEATSWSNTFQ